MRKSITCLILGILSLVSCTEYDEIAMWNKNEDMGSRLSALEELCSQMNTNITSLRQIVEALQDNDYVTGVVPVVENGQTIGYTITFTKSGPVTIYHGRDGQSGSTPVIGVKQDTDGLYYWTLDGEWLLDDQNNKIVAQARDGKSAYELAVENGYQGSLDEWLASLNGIMTAPRSTSASREAMLRASKSPMRATTSPGATSPQSGGSAATAARLRLCPSPLRNGRSTSRLRRIKSSIRLIPPPHAKLRRTRPRFFRQAARIPSARHPRPSFLRAAPDAPSGRQSSFPALP